MTHLQGEFDPLALIDALARHEVQYVIVGGWAAIQHGAVRRTDDLDICPEWSRANLDRLGVTLRKLDAELAISPGNTVPVPIIDGVLLSRMQIGTWHTRAGGFDILRAIPKTATSEALFEELLVHARTAEISGHTILVADLEDVVRSKRIADRPKDHEALPELDKLREAAAAARLRDAAFPSPPSQQLHKPPAPSTQPRPTLYRPATTTRPGTGPLNFPQRRAQAPRVSVSVTQPGAVGTPTGGRASPRHAAGTSFCLIAIELDRFKAVNDTLGPSVGDTLLRELAARLTACIRDEDLLARSGGDEFAVVCTRTDSDHAIAHVAQRVLAAAQQPPWRSPAAAGADRKPPARGVQLRAASPRRSRRPLSGGDQGLGHQPRRQRRRPVRRSRPELLYVLRLELAFYLACLNLHAWLAQKGEPTCFPEPLPEDQVALTARGIYDVCLTLHLDHQVVGNDVHADGKSLVMITGANQGGEIDTAAKPRPGAADDAEPACSSARSHSGSTFAPTCSRTTSARRTRRWRAASSTRSSAA